MDLKYHSDEDDYAIGDCCALASIQGFDYRHEASATGEIIASPANIGEAEAIADELLEMCEEALRDNKSMAMATVNTFQLTAEAALVRAGFKCCTKDWVYRRDKRGNSAGVKVYLKVLP